MINEFVGHNFTTPYNTVLTGEEFIQQSYGISYSDMTAFKWGVIPLLLAFGFVFTAMGIYFLNTLKFNKEAKIIQHLYLAESEKNTIANKFVKFCLIFERFTT